MNKETFYRKVGRKYVPVGEAELYDHVVMPDGFVLTYRKEGRTQWEYGVTPDRAGFMAAAMVARTAMENEISKRGMLSPGSLSSKTYTKRQLGLIRKFKEDMGGMMPLWWTGGTAREIADAGIKAVAGGEQ